MSRMNPLVMAVHDDVMASYQRRRESVKLFTADRLVELEHEMEHLRRHPDFAIRVGAEVVRAAAIMERESREANDGPAEPSGHETHKQSGA